MPSGRGRKVMYSHVDLYKMVENIANTLREQGVRPDTVCAVALPNCVEAIVYFLAIVWIGAIAAPIDVELGLDDVIRALKATKAATLVSPLVDEDDAPEDALYQRMGQAAETLGIVEWHITRTTNEGVVLETHGRRAAEGAAWHGGAADFQPDGTQVALYMASVSDEEPLVLPLTHQNFAAAIRMFSHTYSIDATHVTVLTRPWSTVDALNAMLATIYSGGHLVMPGTEPKPDLDFVELCGDYEVNWFTASPQFLTSLASLNDSTAMASLKYKFVRSITGNLDAATLDSLEETFNAPILEAYGTPETCGVVSCNVQTETRAGSKGMPAADCVIKIFDEATHAPVEPGVSGLVGVAGANVTSGYLDNDEVNSKFIVKEENADGSKTVFVLTGDQGFLDDDGFLHLGSSVSDGRIETFAQERALNVKREKEMALAAAAAAAATVAAVTAKSVATTSSSASSETSSDESEKERLERRLAGERERVEREAPEERECAEREAAIETARIEKEEKERLEREAAEEQERREKEEAERQALIAAEEKARREEQERLEREAVEKEEEERVRREMAEEEERMKREEEERLKRESEARALASEVAAVGATGLASATMQNHSESTTSASISDSTSPRLVQHTATDVVRTHSGTKVAYVQQPALEVSTFDPCALDEIAARLGVIEANQRRLENEVMAQHAADLASLRKLIDARKASASKPIPVDMSEVSAVLNKASKAAMENQRRSEQTLAAARAAIDAAAAKQVAKPPSPPSPRSPRGIVHKQVTVDLSQVEAVITRHVSVEQACGFNRGSEVYCAVKIRNGARVSQQWLKLYAQTNLPSTHVPKVFYEFEELTSRTSARELAELTTLKPVSATLTAAEAMANTPPSARRKITISASSWIPSLRNVRSGRTSMTP